MKFLFVSFVMTVFIACNQNSSDSAFSAIDADILKVSDNKNIFGT